MSSAPKHSAPAVAEEPYSKRAKIKAEGLFKVSLNPADCNIDFTVGKDGLLGSALHGDGFAYCWSGARANLGITGGKYCFGCKVTSIQPVEMEDTPKDQQNLCRVGISRGDDNVASLGESEHSYGYGGTGKFSNSGRFLDYGGRFGVGDTVICAVDLDSKPMAKISFAKNGNWLGVAKEFDVGSRGLAVGGGSSEKKLKWEGALFPHVLLKNVEIKMLFSVDDGLKLLPGFKPWATAVEDGNGVEGPQLGDFRDCEVMMMVGMPAAGKTTWAEKWAKDHPEKRYTVLGTNLALDIMKVPGLMRKKNYGERFERLMDRATKIFNKLIERAAMIPRNYIMDQTNVYRSARIRKLKAFKIVRKVAVVIFPTEEDLKRRCVARYQEMGRAVPPEEVNKMLANYVLPLSKDMPGSIEPFDEVRFPELPREPANKLLHKMKSALPPPAPRFGGKSSEGSSQEHTSREGSIASVHGGYSSSYLAGSPAPYGAGQASRTMGVAKQIARDGYPISQMGGCHNTFDSPGLSVSDVPSYQGPPHHIQHRPVAEMQHYQDSFSRQSSLEILPYKDAYDSCGSMTDRLLYLDPAYREASYEDLPYRASDPRSSYPGTMNLQSRAYSGVGGGSTDKLRPYTSQLPQSGWGNRPY